MHLDSLVHGALVSLTALLVYYTINLLRSPLRAVPGPPLARFTDAWYFWNVQKGSFEQVNQNLHKRYGPIVRYGPHRYSINDPEAAKIIYGPGSNFAKSSWYSAWASPGQWGLFSDRRIRQHARNRKLYQATYAMSALVHYEPFVDECSDLFTRRLEEMAAAAEPSSDPRWRLDMRHWFQCYAFDVVGMITYGARLGFLDRGEDIGGVIGALEDHLGYATLVGIYPSLHRCLFHLRNYWAGERGAGRAYVLSYTKDRIRECQATPKAALASDEKSGAVRDTESFLTKFLAKHSADPDVFTSFHVLAGCTSNMVAGSDTTAISLSAVLYYLLKYPKTLQKLRDEIDSLTEQGGLSALPTFKESQQMPYLQAVIKEALRMHPATGLPMERIVPEGGATISGHFFPEGTVVGINTWVAHRNPAVFGDDADVFRPERWLEDGSSEKLSLMNRYWMPFGLGSRTCIGRHVSMLEISKLMPRLIRDYDFELDEALQREGWSTNNYWFVKPLDFQLRVRMRRK